MRLIVLLHSSIFGWKPLKMGSNALKCEIFIL